MAQWINDEGEFWDGTSVVINNRRYLSPSAEILTQAGYHEFIEPEPTEEQLISQAKDEKLDQIDEYDQSSNVNLFYLAGQPMWLDAQTRQTLRISIESYQAMGIDNVTKWFGGQQFTFPIQAWLTMLNALEVYAAEALNVTEAHKAAVQAMTNLEDIQSFDITVGYPEKLNLSQEFLTKNS